jgi:hypothetical protein
VHRAAVRRRPVRSSQSGAAGVSPSLPRWSRPCPTLLMPGQPVHVDVCGRPTAAIPAPPRRPRPVSGPRRGRRVRRRRPWPGGSRPARAVRYGVTVVV